MALFGKKKKSKTPEPVVEVFQKIAQPANNLEHLDKDGELPWGWHTANKKFTDKIQAEMSYFNKQVWAAEDDGNPVARRNALKSVLQYMDDVRKLCDNKGETFSFWCSEILIGQNYSYMTEKLNALEKNMDAEMQKYQQKQKEREFAEALTDDIIIEAIKQNPDILQKDFYDVFDSAYKLIIKDRLYHMTKEGKIERIKSGNSYMLKVK